MATSSAGFHEADDRLRPETKDLHRALVSLQEELEAIDWYQQRIDATGDDELRVILAHNRDEEMEHASMLLEWIRRKNPTFAGHLREYLFSEGPIGTREEAAPDASARNGTAAEAARTTIGSLRGGAR